MSETLSLTLIAISAVVVAICALASTALLLVLSRRLRDLSRQIDQLTERLRDTAVPAVTEVRYALRSLGRLAAVSAWFARPVLTAMALRSTPRWLRSLRVLAETLSVARQIVQEFATTGASARRADRPARQPQPTRQRPSTSPRQPATEAGAGSDYTESH